jgi:hypothetical protein
MKQQVNIRLSSSAVEKLNWLAKRYGTQTTVVEIALNKLYTQESMMRIIYGVSIEHNAFAATIEGSEIWNAVEISGIHYRRLNDDEGGSVIGINQKHLNKRLDALDAELMNKTK